MITEFKSLGDFNITGRGRVFLVHCPDEHTFYNLRGAVVTINGNKYVVTGVETTLGMMPGSAWERVKMVGGNVGLLVRPAPAEPALTPREGPEVPFDRGSIAGIRESTDKKRNGASLYDQKPCNINWLWWERMVTTLEECQSLRERVKELEKNV